MATQPTGGQPAAKYPVDGAVPKAPGSPMARAGTGRSSPPALVTSVVFGAVGALLLLAGLVGGSEPLVLGGVAAGTLSLVAVLVWREQLIAAWRQGRQGTDPTLRPGSSPPRRRV